MALKADGTVIAWGDNGYGQTNLPGGLTNVVAIAAGWDHSLALKQDGSVVGWGDNTYGECTAPAGLTNVVAIAGGGSWSLAIVALPPPTVTLSMSRNLTVLFWPTNAIGYGLESTPSLGSRSWETITNAPVIAADCYVVTNFWSDQARFFRLRQR